MKTYRGVIIGDSARGAFGHFLDLAFTRSPRVEVVAVAEPVEVELKKVIERSKAQRGYTDYRQMLKKERPEIGVVAPRWCDQKRDMVLACVEAGVKGIYLEKPIAATPADADAMVAACEGAGVRVVVDHWRATGEVQKAGELIEGGAIGRLQRLCGHGKADERSGGVDLMVLGTHVLDAMIFLSGAEAVWAHGHVTKGGRDVTKADAFEGPECIGRTAGDALTVDYTFENGVHGRYESIRAVKPTDLNYLGIEVQGTEGVLSLRQRSLSRSAKEAPGAWKNIPLSGWEDLNHQAYYERCHEVCIGELIGAIEENRPLQRNVSTLADGRAVIEMIAAVHKSHLAGRRVALPLTSRENPYS